MFQRKDELLRSRDPEDAAVGGIGRWRAGAVAMAALGLLILFLSEPPRGAEGLLAWVLLAMGMCAMWLSYTRVGRDIASAAEFWLDRQGSDRNS
ncbi:MAG TPA: hypothetical protein VEC19_06275 [Usitatibacter sp.]|nr:hypothetical protein [Usitatibacter sp.]